MANNLAALHLRRRPNLLRHITARCLNSAPSPAAVSSHDHHPSLTLTEKPNNPDHAGLANSAGLDLHDHRSLFSSFSTAELLRSSAVLQAAGMDPMVDLGTWLMNSRLMHIQPSRTLLMSAIKHSFFRHFCAGETEEEAGECVRRVHKAGLRSMPFFSVEHTTENDACERNLQRFLQSVELSQSVPPASVSFVVVKITAICPIRLLRKVSDLLRWQHKDPSLHLPWKLHTFPIFSDSSPLYHTPEKPEPLTDEEEKELQVAHQRLFKLCHRCLEASMPLLVDAEDTWLQPSIDYLTYSSAIMYNQADDKPIVYNTIQAYLKDSKERLFQVAKTSQKLGVPMGFKLVRGAYMSSERQLASSLGFESPVHNTITETHRCYNECASFMLDKIAEGYGGVVLATHNSESGQLAAAKATELGIPKGNGRLEFAQLYGMAEALSFGLRNAGFQVSKYMPYGPLEKVIPYLLRRAEENRGLLSASTYDRKLLRKELWRRLRSMQMF